MLSELSHDKAFEKLTKRHIIAIIEHLLGNNYHFGILCRIDHVTFMPDLSTEIKDEFRPLTLFYLAGYTFETAHMNGENLVFEAGFGPDNLGSQVSVPLLDIIQIIVEETPIFVNSTAKSQAKTVEPQSNDAENARESSMEALMANPENQKFINRKK